MHELTKLCSIATLVGAFGVAAMAQSPVGNWKGKLVFDRAAVKATLEAVSAVRPKAEGGGPTAEERKKTEAMVDSMVTELEKSSFTLTLKEGKSWTMVAKGMPGKSDVVTEGTWTQEGKSVTMTATKEGGKPIAKPKSGRAAEPMVFAFKDARTLVCTQNQFGFKMQLVFGRA